MSEKQDFEMQVQSFPEGSFIFLKMPTDEDGSLIFNAEDTNTFAQDLARAMTAIRSDLTLIVMPDKFVIQSYNDYLSAKEMLVECLNRLENIEESGGTVKVDD